MQDTFIGHDEEPIGNPYLFKEVVGDSNGTTGV